MPTIQRDIRKWWPSITVLCFTGVALALFILTPQNRTSAEPGATGNVKVKQPASANANRTEKERAARQSAETRQRAADAAMKAFTSHVNPFLQNYCVDCHSGEMPEGEVKLHEFRDESAVFHGRKTWMKVIGMLQQGLMPPPDHPTRPSAKETKRVVDWIDSTFINFDCSLVHDPGRVTIRRLNRAEYNNTIRDLVGVDFQPAKDFPSDDVGYGFDNIGDVLTLPPLLMEKYLDAAEKISRAAIIVGDLSQLSKQRLAGEQMQGRGAGAVVGKGYRPINSTGAVFGEFRFEQAGEYILRAEAMADQAGEEPARMEFRIEGQKIEVHDIQGHRQAGLYETRIQIGGKSKLLPGKKVFEAAFINDYYMPKAKDPKQRDRNLAVRSLEVQGPLGLKEHPYPETHQRIVFVTPDEKKSAAECARQVFLRFAARAYRRPVEEAEIEGMVRLVQVVLDQGDEFERGIQLGLQAILVSPHFLFRVENDREPDNPNTAHRIGQYELASRLSYFLWSSLPDAELFDLAERGVLGNADVLEQQVRRMLKDPKSRALVENFASQWLNLRILDTAIPDPKTFAAFTNQLRADMRRETELLFEAVMHENRSVLDFLDADFTYVNERLAKHYGIPGIQGDEFRKVSLKATPRGGVLTHASILTLTSDPNRTLPVKRGKWILENILGTPPPPPPPGVPELIETRKANPKATLRKQLELHRTNPTCASCHTLMDPLGIGFENFDAIGRWREKEDGRAIESAGQLPGGDRFSTPKELVKLLRKRKEQFSRHLTRTMLTYALGRGLEYYDKCAVETITKALAEDGYRFHTLVIMIVGSDPFLMRRGDGEPGVAGLIGR